ncbi:MAG: alpha-amylase family protein [Candidatus Firestonebacteria bacterium]
MNSIYKKNIDFPSHLIGAHNHEPMEFRIRYGNNTVIEEKLYSLEHSESALEKLKKTGVNLIWVHGYKGFGLKYEKAALQDVSKFAKLCHKHGFLMCVYIQTLPVFYETILDEYPKAKDWFQINALGEPNRYTWQYFRYKACINNEDFIKYIEKVISYVLKNIQLDMVFFDNLGWSEEPYSCHCDSCQTKFKNYLMEKYNSEDLIYKRFGLKSFKYVKLPQYSTYFPAQSLKVIKDPLIQDWIDFRVLSFNNFLKRICGKVNLIRKEVKIYCNIASSPFINTSFIAGYDVSLLPKEIDYYRTEDALTRPTLLKNNALICNVREYKIAHTLERKMIGTIEGEPPTTEELELYLSNILAFNKGNLGFLFPVLIEKDRKTKLETVKKYIDFLSKFKVYYEDITPVSDVACLRSSASLSYSVIETVRSVVLFEQTLLQNQILFSIIFDKNLEELEKYKVLILANQECLSDYQIEKIKNFVKNGGGLVITENTACYNEKRRLREKMGLYQLFKNEGLENIFYISSPHTVPKINKEIFSQSIKSNFKAGKVIYIPHITPEPDERAYDPFSPFKQIHPDMLKLPLNWEELKSAVKWASNEKLSIEVVNAPNTVLIELYKKDISKEIIIHLVNFDLKNSVKNINVKLKLKEKVKEVISFSPDRDKIEKIKFVQTEEGVKFVLPLLKIYEIIGVRVKESI